MNQLSEEQKKREKNRIITELYNSGEIQKKIEGMCYRNHIKPDTYIHEDCVSETFYWLSRYDTDKLIEAYNDNKSRVIGLATRIAVLKCFSKTGYPKHSIAHWILYSSNLQSLNFYDTTENHNDEDGSLSFLVLTDKEDTNATDELFKIIRSKLTEEQNNDLEYFLNLPKKRGQLKKEIKLRYKDLLTRIEEIILEQKIYL